MGGVSGNTCILWDIKDGGVKSTYPAFIAEQEEKLKTFKWCPTQPDIFAVSSMSNVVKIHQFGTALPIYTDIRQSRVSSIAWSLHGTCAVVCDQNLYFIYC